jgi:hypothetical protein
MTIVFAGRDGVQTYRAIALKHGLRLYAKTGLRPNRMWTPSAMLLAAAEFTGKKYRRGEYERAASDLGAWLANFGTTGDER